MKGGSYCTGSLWWSHLLSLRVPSLLIAAELLHLFIPPPLLALLLLPQLSLPTLLLWAEST